MIDKIYDLDSFDKEKLLEEMQRLHAKVNLLQNSLEVERMDRLEKMLTKVEHYYLDIQGIWDILSKVKGAFYAEYEGGMDKRIK